MQNRLLGMFRTAAIVPLALLLLFPVSAYRNSYGAEATSKTAAFFGGPDEVLNMTLVYRQVSALFGGLEVFVRGNGEITVVRLHRNEKREMQEIRHRTSDLKQVESLTRKIIASDLLAVPLETNTNDPLPTDYGQPFLAIRNAAGEILQLTAITKAPSAVYDSVLTSIRSLESKFVAQPASYDGPIKSGYVPDGFEWAISLLEPLRSVPWAPHVTDAQKEQNEIEYQIKVEKQLEEISRQKEEERKAAENPDDR